ncbi:chorismate mutase [Vitiosangium sp. GDMCC 1.1324]|uniref:chorismate mutase n=1 Tax=Vitiosangium sp. (strain GDMCC 1.1324) TaxID=2138576 RepID=UPI0018EEB00F
MNDKLKPLREKIDAIDAQSLHLLNERAKVAQEVGHVKTETNAPVLSIGGMGALLRARAGVGGRPGGPRDTHWTVQEGPEQARPSRSCPPSPALATALLGLRHRVHPSAVRHSHSACCAGPWQVPGVGAARSGAGGAECAG